MQIRSLNNPESLLELNYRNDEGDHLSEVVLVPHEQNDDSDQLGSEKDDKISC